MDFVSPQSLYTTGLVEHIYPYYTHEVRLKCLIKDYFALLLVFYFPLFHHLSGYKYKVDLMVVDTLLFSFLFSVLKRKTELSDRIKCTKEMFKISNTNRDTFASCYY